jgi:Type IV secretion system pilin
MGLQLFLLVETQLRWATWRLLVLADVGTSFSNIANTLAGFLGGALGIVIVISGYQLMAAGEDVQQATRAKRALGIAIVGAILVGTYATLATTLKGDIAP